jgi:hypothetical protein
MKNRNDVEPSLTAYLAPNLRINTEVNGLESPNESKVIDIM